MASLKNNTITDNHLNLFEGGGQMGSLMRTYDWDAHPLGNPEHWPDSLKTTIRIILQSAYPMFIWWSPELYMFHNDPYLPALGKKHPQALGASARIMWAEIWEQIGSIVEEILRGGKAFYAEDLLIVLERKGFLEETYWTFSYSAAPNDEGGVGGIFCACNEVTNTVLGQRRLKTIKDIADSTAQIHTVEQACLKASDVLHKNEKDIPFSLIYLLNSKGTEARLLGKTGKLSKELTPPVIHLNQQDTFWPLKKIQQTGRIATIPLSSPMPGGAWSEPSKTAVILPIFKPSQQQLIGFFISGVSPKLEYDADYQNFHELLIGQIATSIASVQAREEAERQQADLINLFQQAPVAIAILRGSEFVVELANPGICEIWGRSHTNVINKPVFEALPEVRGQGIEDLLQSVLHTGIPYVANELPLMLDRKGRLEKVHVNFVYYPLRNANGIITGIIVIAIEVSEQVKARGEIEAKNAELLTINADLDNFVYSASHDLKAPISNIEGLMQTLIRYLPAESLTSDKIKRIIDLIQTSVERFKKTVNDLTEITKLQREAKEDITLVHLPDVISEVCLDLEPMITASGAHIETHYHHCPPVSFSTKNLRSVVYNLLSNALKYRSPERQLLIRITTKVIPDYTVLTVTDNGLGMDLTQETKIFSMFKRLHDHVEGSGIGLYIVKKIVDNAGGKIEVESQVDQGATFRIYFRH